MAQLVTNGIKISVKTRYSGVIHTKEAAEHVFTYYISISNTSKNTIQLLERHWEITDSMNKTIIVDGEGVVGQTPILDVDDHYTYRSNSTLKGHFGIMKGWFTMMNLHTSEKFIVTIPTFQLNSKAILN